MDSIFFEKQEAALCAQHALNMLLQGSYFTAVDLAELARELDRRESGMLNNAAATSQNMDDSGYFSVQVVQHALNVWNLELVPLRNPRAAPYRQEPTVGRAYICNHREHWFTVRKFGFQWFQLNSLLNGPQLISDTYLSLFFEQLHRDGYSIFAVLGDLPQCVADDVLTATPVDPALAARSQPIRQNEQEDPELARAIALSLSRDQDPSVGAALDASRLLEDEEDRALQDALKMSLADVVGDEDDEMERQLQRALELSMQGGSGQMAGKVNADEMWATSATKTASEVNDQFQPGEAIPLKKSNENQPGPSSTSTQPVKIANSMSMNPSTSIGNGNGHQQQQPVADVEAIRRQREAFLQRFDKNK